METAPSVHDVQFNNYLVELIQKLRTVAPSESRVLSKYYKYYRDHVSQDKRLDFIAEFVGYLGKYSKEVSICDEGLFSEEEAYYPQKPIQLMKGIDFKKIWRNSDMTEGSKESIWKYLQTLFLIGSFVLKEHERFQELLKKQREVIDGLIQNLKYEQQIKKEADKLNEEEERTETLGGLGDLFDENNVVIQIAMEVAKELNLTDAVGGDPTKTLGLLFGQDSAKLQEIIQKVSQKLTHVLKKKNISEKELIEQAKGMYDKLLGKFKGLPGMNNIEKMSQQFADELAHNLDQAGQDDQIPNMKPEQLEQITRDLTSTLRSNFEQMDPAMFEMFRKTLDL